MKLSLSKFYKICPRLGYKKATKKTDMCEICVEGGRMEKLLERDTLSEEQRMRLDEHYRAYTIHKQLVSHQKAAYEYSIRKASKDSAVVVFDFKENIRIGGGPVEVGRDFYNKKQASTQLTLVDTSQMYMQSLIHLFIFK